MFKEKDEWGGQAERCQFDGHYMSLSHICVYKNCDFKRIGCIQCQNVLHNHKLGKQSFYLQFEDFKKYIKVIIDNQLLKYNLNEQLIIQLKKEDKNCPKIKETIQSLQKTQIMLLQNFKLAEIRWNPFSDINNSIIQEIIQMDGNGILRQDQINQILLSQLRQIGLQICNQENKKQDQKQIFVMEENNCNIYKKQICNLCYSIYLWSFPNGAYKALSCLDKMEIFQIKSSKRIVRRMLRISQIIFLDESKFYLYCDLGNTIHFMAINNSQKLIMKHVLAIKQTLIIIFPMNKNEILISSNKKYFIILRIDNRSVRQYIHITDAQLRSFAFDDQNKVIICGTQQTISFHNYYTSSIVFEKQIQCGQVQQIKSTNHLIIGNQVCLYLYIINYQKKELYLLNKFPSQFYQLLVSIFNSRYPIIKMESGVIILDEGLNQIKYFGFKERFYLRRQITPVLLCTKYKLQIFYPSKQVINQKWYN